MNSYSEVVSLVQAQDAVKEAAYVSAIIAFGAGLFCGAVLFDMYRDWKTAVTIAGFRRD